MTAGTRRNAVFHGLYFARYLEDYTVYLVSRPRGLPEGYTAGESATTHVRILESVTAPADVLGISMGGMIALELAKDRPISSNDSSSRTQGMPSRATPGPRSNDSVSTPADTGGRPSGRR